mgnify:CR=1 FL=1
MVIKSAEEITTVKIKIIAAKATRAVAKNI